MNGMKKFASAMSLLMVLFSTGIQDVCVASVPSDSLKYLGFSFVKVRTAQGEVVFIDPCGVNDFADSADVVLITHEHSDHNDLSRVRRKPACRVIRSADALKAGAYQSFTIGGVKVTAVPAYNGYHDKTRCVGYVVEFDGIRIYHAGDTGKIAEMADLAAQDITYALLPMDGTYTMTPEAATEAAAMIRAEHDIPIHTAFGPNRYSDAVVERFTSPNKLVVHPDETIALESGSSSVGGRAECPRGCSLGQNYPNPFNPETTVSYSIPGESFVSLQVFDASGREVGCLVNGRQAAGTYKLQFRADRLSSGIYFIELRAGGYVDVKKCALIR